MLFAFFGTRGLHHGGTELFHEVSCVSWLEIFSHRDSKARSFSGVAEAALPCFLRHTELKEGQ